VGVTEIGVVVVPIFGACDVFRMCMYVISYSSKKVMANGTYDIF